jgi:hypothetical protein
MLRLSLLWLGTTLLLGPLVWGIISALTGAAIQGPFSALLPNVIAAAMWAIVAMPLWGPLYAVTLLSWPRIAAGVPALERSGFAIGVSTTLLSLPVALVVGWSYSVRMPFIVPFLVTLVSAWICLVLPRLLIPRLKPGGFLNSS